MTTGNAYENASYPTTRGTWESDLVTPADAGSRRRSDCGHWVPFPVDQGRVLLCGEQHR